MRPVFFSALILILAALLLSPAGAATARPLASLSLTFRSIAAQDGRIVESGENTGMGGAADAAGINIQVGDNAANQQLRAILSFNTATLPDTATILSVKLKIKRAGITGTNPFTTHSALVFDMRKPCFGASCALAPADFQAAAGKLRAGQFSPTPVSGGSAYLAQLPASSFTYINKTGLTQFRLRFLLDDNNDAGADYLSFRSGNYVVVSDRPELEVEYNP